MKFIYEYETNKDWMQGLPAHDVEKIGNASSRIPRDNDVGDKDAMANIYQSADH